MLAKDMDSGEPDGNGAGGALPPPPPVIPPNIVPIRAETEQIPEPVKKKPLRLPIARRGLGSKGQKISLVTNHFKVNVTNLDGHFFHYSVCIVYFSLYFLYLFKFIVVLGQIISTLICILCPGCSFL